MSTWSGRLPRFFLPRRQAYVLLHRWTGLTIALFLTIASLTGIALAFEDELECWLAPQLQLAAPADGAAATFLSPYELQTRVQAALGPGVRVESLMLHPRPGRSLMWRVQAAGDAQGKPVRIGFNQVFVNPYDGAILGTRDSEAISLRPQQLMPFLFKLHHSLALPGIWGTLLMGVISVIWTLDCFVGIYLTWPLQRPYLNRWGKAWKIKLGSSNYRFIFDLHRAGGLWLWLMLLLFAWSSVMFNLRQQVYEPVMSAIFKFDNSWRGAPRLPKPMAAPPLSWPQAHALARERMQTYAQAQGFVIDFEELLAFDGRRGLYAYLVHSNLDLRKDTGNTGILIDARSGELRGHWLPTGDVGGNTFSNWIGALHMGHVFGLPYRIFISLVGLMVAVLSVSGVYIWWKKRKGRAGTTSNPEKIGKSEKRAIPKPAPQDSGI
ncbi:PepSY-associated TM helix domain-containing protein [Herbaspirillum lusitanum]|uniref:PepSY-associated TM helix domain-containing protein n=1 Tax=Herbaspirillum lusitanum TaxID=213312 RepID=A0ABW9ADB0_9BURK